MASVSPNTDQKYSLQEGDSTVTESRISERYVPLDHVGAIRDTLDTVVDGVNQTTEYIRKKKIEKVTRRTYQTEMDVNGYIDVEPNDEFLTTRLKSISTEDMQKELSKIKDDQKQHAVTDTLAALVYDVNATAEVLRRGSLKKKKAKDENVEVEYKLRLTPAPDEEFPSPQPPRQSDEDNTCTAEKLSHEYGVDMSDSRTNSLSKRARSETPRRTINIESTPPPSALPICAFCSESIEGPIITALAPNSYRAQKFHPYHFMCSYCLKALNLRGTYREHERKPYCHECFFRLYNGLIYSPDENQAKIEKLI